MKYRPSDFIIAFNELPVDLQIDVLNAMADYLNSQEYKEQVIELTTVARELARDLYNFRDNFIRSKYKLNND